MLKVFGAFLLLSTFVLTVHSFDILDIGSKVEVIKGEAVELSCVADQVIQAIPGFSIRGFDYALTQKVTKIRK